MLFSYFLPILVVIEIKLCYGEISDKQYATMPPLFHQDNYDECMLLGDDAWYCSFTYKVRSKTDGENEIWKIIQEVSSNKYNYRHDHLRHWICVPSTCPEINLDGKNHSEVCKDVEHCYDTKYSRYGLRGSIENFKCENKSTKYPLDWLDIVVALIFTLNTVLVVFGTFYDGTARYKSEEEYKKLTSKGWRRMVSAFSIPRNWHRLITVNMTPDNEKLRSIQGIRFYANLLVILAHTVLSAVIGPVANTKYVERIPGTLVSLLLSNSNVIMSLFFFTSAFLVIYLQFSQFEKRKCKLKDLVVAVISRYIRLTPCLLMMIAFFTTWLRHLGNGPIWNDFIDTQSGRCRKNWWTNLLYVNNFVDSKNMCLTHTWYLASDTQYFIIMLLIVWILKKNEKLVWPILGSLFSIAVVATFLDNYVENYEGLIFPLPEKLYEMKIVLDNVQWHHQSKSFKGNFIGSIVGLAFGYLFYKNKNKSLFDKNVMNQIIYHILVYGLGLGMAIIPPVIIMNKETDHDIFWASLNVALGRTIFIIAIGSAMFLTFFGLGWITKAALEWHPTYILARLSFSAYLVHTTIIYFRVATSRFPTYVSDLHLVYYWFGDLITSYALGLLMTLFVEMPTSELQKMMIPTRTEKKE